MEDQFARTRLLIGDEALEKLKMSRVAVFGIGGVGGHAAEALARTGIGTIDLIDDDKVSLTNLNRQLVALHSTIGRHKTEVMRERIKDICPETEVIEHRRFFLPENKHEFPFAAYDYVIDAVDTVTAKIALIEAAIEAGTPVISSMGAGNKLDPTRFRVADIYETSVCPLAKVMRKELKKRGIKKLKCVYSEETPVMPLAEETQESEDSSERERETGKHNARRSVPGSVAFVPSVAGLIIAGEVIKDLIDK